MKAYCYVFLGILIITAVLKTILHTVVVFADYVFEKLVIAFLVPISVITLTAIIIYSLIQAGIRVSLNTPDLSSWKLIYTVGFDLSVAYMIYLVFGNIGKTTGNMLSIATHLRALLPTLDQKQKEGDYHELSG